MIAVVYGTVGELIKLAPVLRLLRERGSSPMTVCTGQHVEQIPALLEHLHLPAPDLWLARGRRGRDVHRRGDFPPWFASVCTTFARQRRGLRRALAGDGLVMVHGDTFTTPIGALMGRSLGATVAHLEAGYRSGDWRHPFPEELNRRATARIAQIHFAPGDETVANLRGEHVRGEIVNTLRNTVVDSLELAPPSTSLSLQPAERFGVVTIHRFELLSNPSALRELLDILHLSSRRTPLLFIDYPVTAAVIEAEGLADRFDTRLRRVPRQNYFDFISLLKASAFLVTDSGGSQQECAQLGLPCLVHRAKTETADGLGGSVVLSGMDPDVVRAFLKNPETHARPAAFQQVKPSEIVVDHLAARGFL